MSRFDVAISSRRWANLNGAHGSPIAHYRIQQTWLQAGIKAIRALDETPRLDPPVRIVAVVRRTTRAKADAHNVTPAIKACIDAVVHCGVIEDDNDSIVAELSIRPGPIAAQPTIELAVIEATGEEIIGWLHEDAVRLRENRSRRK